VFMFFQLKSDIITILFTAHFLVVITIALVHSMDIGRYGYVLFPWLAIITFLLINRIFGYLVSVKNVLT
jgi:hypothetical protein